MKRFLIALAGSGLGAAIGFAGVFYGYLVLHPPGPSRVEFEAASGLAFFLGTPAGLAAGAAAGFVLAGRRQQR